MSNPAFNGFWYNDKQNCAALLDRHIRFIYQQTQGHFKEMLNNHRMYTNQNVMSFSPYNYFKNVIPNMSLFDSSTMNIISRLC